jgi:catechol 2,3-dioxygenase-like lactoylglutathione lyase family enzyme
MLSGLNHLTLAVLDLERSLQFYGSLLGCRIRATWRSGAYLSLGDLWLCLSLDSNRSTKPVSDYTHYAFSIAQEEFGAFARRLRENNVIEWKENRSEGDSLYFLDPDGHKLEVHSGDLATRLAQCRIAPYDAMRFFD